LSRLFISMMHGQANIIIAFSWLSRLFISMMHGQANIKATIFTICTKAVCRTNPSSLSGINAVSNELYLVESLVGYFL